MLKFLRKYSQWILVIGGTLLMIAFLLPTTLQELGRQPLFTTVMTIDGDRIGAEEYQQAIREHQAMDRLTLGTLPMISNVENTDHWLLLVHEAERGGYVAGHAEGVEFLPDLVRQIFFASGMAYTIAPDELEKRTQEMVAGIEANLPTVQSQFGLTEQQLHAAISRLHGIIRMQVAYQRAAKYSDRRLAAGMKRLSDQTQAEVIFVPADQVITDVPEPTEEEIAAHFNRYKDVEPGTGDLGIGYRQPDRVKLEWLTLDRAAIGAAVRPDPVEVHKRFLKAVPSGQPAEGQTLEQAKAPYETEVRTELVDRVMRAADQAVRGEFERALRRTQPDVQYRKLPEDWAQTRPDLVAIRDAVVTRVQELTGVSIPGPVVNRRNEWLFATQASGVQGIGGAFVQRGSLREPFSQHVFRVRELAGDNDAGLQVGVPGESLTDFAGNRYYMVITEARKASAPESIDEVRTQVVTDLKRIAAFERLREQLDAYRQRAIADGLQSIVDEAGGAIAQPKRVTFMSRGMFPSDPQLASDAFRDAVVEVGSKLDPGVNIPELPADGRTVAVAIPKSFGIAIASVVGVSPITEETWRRGQASAVANLTQDELQLRTASESPFSFKRLRERLKVEYKTGGPPKQDDEEQDATS